MFAAVTIAMPAKSGAVYTSFDPSGSIDTSASCMNDSGTIAGDYDDANNVSHGFVRTIDGTITRFDPEGSADTRVGYAQCIDSKGWITGSYDAAGGGTHGYLRAPDGTITRFDPVGSVFTWATGINSDRTVVGSYAEGNEGSDHGFFRTSDGTITSFDPPDSLMTEASQINREGDIVGTYSDRSAEYVFLRRSDGTYQATDLGGAFSISAASLNNDDIVTGYAAIQCGVHNFCTVGFVWTPGESYALFYASLHHARPPTEATCINEKGLIAGSSGFVQGLYPHHGFLRSGSGTIRLFDPPASAGTYVSGCDDRGDVTGSYLDSDGVWHGFVRSR